MCMPETDQVVQILRQHLNSAMNWVKTQAIRLQQQGIAGNDACLRCWTRAIDAALCHASIDVWGGCNPLRICATAPLGKPAQETVCHQMLLQHQGHICSTQFGPYADLGNNEHEWLFDVTCLKYEGEWPTQQKVRLVAEVEWSGENKIRNDFAKLLVTRAEVRVMVYHQHCMEFDRLAEYIHQCEDTQLGDTYLLAAFGDAPDTPRIVYYRIDAHKRGAASQCELAPIAEDYYP